MTTVYWPPGYYILRDRIPFFLTLLYMHNDSEKLYYLGFAGVGLVGVATGISTWLYLQGRKMGSLFGINWSAPSPIEWGLFIILTTVLLYSRGLPIFESYYLSFITAMGGGWLYEFIPTLLYNFDYIAFFKINAVKVFFMEFQILCLPILGYIIYEKHSYKPSKLLLPIALLFVLFSVLNPQIMAWFRVNMGYYAYRWYVRLPSIALLTTVLAGVHKK